jgi:hypothetical protein
MARTAKKFTLDEIVDALGATNIDEYPTAAAARFAGQFVEEMRRAERGEWRPDGSALPTTGPRDPGVGASPHEE